MPKFLKKKIRDLKRAPRIICVSINIAALSDIFFFDYCALPFAFVIYFYLFIPL